MVRQQIVYRPAERPLCEAFVDGRWVPAEVRMWTQGDDGAWSADVGYSPSPAVSRTGTFRSSDLRTDAAHASPPGGPSRGAWGDDAFSVT